MSVCVDLVSVCDRVEISTVVIVSLLAAPRTKFSAGRSVLSPKNVSPNTRRMRLSPLAAYAHVWSLHALLQIHRNPSSCPWRADSAPPPHRCSTVEASLRLMAATLALPTAPCHEHALCGIRVLASYRCQLAHIHVLARRREWRPSAPCGEILPLPACPVLPAAAPLR